MLAVLPLEGSDSVQSSQSRELLQEALAQWRGITVVDHYQVADAYRRRGGIRTTDDAAFIATSLGAGRYVRGRVSRTSNSFRAAVSLYDARSPRVLQQAAEDVPNDLAGARLAYTRLANSLLLRGASADSIHEHSSESHVLPAVQAFAQSQRALDEWNLAGADSALEAAITYDPDYARASLWLAQVRAWRGLNSTQWGSVAERAVTIPAGLSERELALAQALVALSQAHFQGACDIYDRLRRRNDRDFAAWFGLGQCRSMDRIVVPDSASPSRWSYRSNYKLALEAYTKAFDILPSVHRGYERGAFERLRTLLLLTSRSARTGYSISDSAMFYARPAWLHDGLALVPYPWQQVFSGDPRAIPPGIEAAVRHQRNEFRRIAAGWSAAFPGSADAKYAVALSLELLGDRGSIDTIRVARHLTADASKRLRFATTEAMLLLKFSSPDRLEDLRSARALADSLLRTSANLSGSDRNVLGPVAALAGRCEESDRAARAAVPVAAPFRFPPSLWADAQALVATTALGCRASAGLSLRALAATITREYGQEGPQATHRVDEMLLSRPALLAETPDSLILARLATVGGSGRVEAALALARHDRATARARLDTIVARWQPALGATTPDILFPEARLWASLGDTAMATRRLDLTLTNASAYDPEDFTEPANVAAFIRAMALRADLAAAQRDSAGARRWAEAVAILWAKADTDLQPLVRRMIRYAGMQ
jgi:tetratricopeptide (TPR) repeat protein